MTPNEIRIAIAEICGWKHFMFEGFDGENYNEPFKEPRWKLNDKIVFDEPPNYPLDLNAMHEAEKTLTGEQFLKYAEELNRVTKCFKHITPAIMACATALQRAEAFLRVFGKWREG